LEANKTCFLDLSIRDLRGYYLLVLPIVSLVVDQFFKEISYSAFGQISHA